MVDIELSLEFIVGAFEVVYVRVMKARRKRVSVNFVKCFGPSDIGCRIGYFVREKS